MYWFVLQKSSAWKDGEPHLQDDIRRDELDGECRDATEEEAEERHYPEDPSDWPAPHQITDSFRQNMTETGPLKCPDRPYPRSEASNRQFSKAYCNRLLSNGKIIERHCLLYSKKANKVYCFPCKLFGSAKTCDKRLVLGYNNWQCLSKTLHETSNHHIDAYLSWKELATRLQLGKTLFQAFPKHQELL